MSETGSFGGMRKVKKGVEESIRTDISLIHKSARFMGISPEDALFFINAVSDSIVQTLIEQGHCRVRALGIFTLQSVKNGKFYKSERKDFITIPMRYVVRFKPSNSVKVLANAKIQKNVDNAIKDKRVNDEICKSAQPLAFFKS